MISDKTLLWNKCSPRSAPERLDGIGDTGEPFGFRAANKQCLLPGKTCLTEETEHNDFTESIYMNTDSHNLS